MFVKIGKSPGCTNISKCWMNLYLEKIAQASHLLVSNIRIKNRLLTSTPPCCTLEKTLKWNIISSWWKLHGSTTNQLLNYGSKWWPLQLWAVSILASCLLGEKWVKARQLDHRCLRCPSSGSFDTYCISNPGTGLALTMKQPKPWQACSKINQFAWKTTHKQRQKENFCCIKNYFARVFDVSYDKGFPCNSFNSCCVADCFRSDLFFNINLSFKTFSKAESNFRTRLHHLALFKIVLKLNFCDFVNTQSTSQLIWGEISVVILAPPILKNKNVSFSICEAFKITLSRKHIIIMIENHIILESYVSRGDLFLNN